ncbi:MAG: hypothetical protein U1A27_00225 [Phycisphaerae bacterium]
MNCPQCHQAVGLDQWGYGDAIPIRDPITHDRIGYYDTLTVRCPHCGLFDVWFRAGRIAHVRRPHEAEHVARCLRRLPANAIDAMGPA